MSGAIEGVVQLDRSGPPPRVMLDTVPPQQLDVPWRDVIGCWLMRVKLSWVRESDFRSLVLELLVVVHRGPFVRVPGEDAFWPFGEKYGLALESVAAVAQRDQRKATQQMKLALSSPSSLLGDGIRLPRRHRKGHRP